MDSRQVVVFLIVSVAVYWYWQRHYSTIPGDGLEDREGKLEDEHSAAFLRRKRDVCFNVRAVKSLQALQLRRALYEQSLFYGKNDDIDDNDNQNDNENNDGDNANLKGKASSYARFKKNAYKSMYVNFGHVTSFYNLNFGGTSMLLPEKYSKEIREAFYYQILKGANVYIRYLFYRYAYKFGDQFDFKDNTCKLHVCTDNDIHTMNPIELRSAYFSYNKNKRFPFTFVRHPLKRFVSAYTEIEYKWNTTAVKPPSELFSVLARPGSHARFEEFVNSLLTYFGKQGEENDGDKFESDESSPKVMRYQDEDDLEDKPIRALFDITSDYSDMFHIAPMIGTILLARDKEKNGDVHLYRLEDFDKQWKNITSILGINTFDAKVLENHPPHKYAHESSGDPLNTTLSALSLLGFSSDEAFSHMFVQRTSSSSSSSSSDTSSNSNNVDRIDDSISGSNSNKNNNINANLTSCSDDLFCYKDSKIMMPMTTTKQFDELRKRSRFITRSICRIYLADFQCMNYDLPSVCLDLADEWAEDAAVYIKKNSAQSGLFSADTYSAGAMVRALPEGWQRMVSELFCFFDRNPPQCMVNLMHPHDSVARDMSHTELDANEIGHIEEHHIEELHDEL